MRKPSLLLMAGIITLLCAGCLQFGRTDDINPPSDMPLLISTFDGGSSVEWAPVPDERYWVVENGRYGLADHAPNGVPQGTLGRQSDWNGVLWDNYVLSAHVAFECSEGEWPGPHDDGTSILFRVVDAENYMELQFEPWGWRLQACSPQFLYPYGPPAGVLVLYSHRDGEVVFLGHCPFGQLDASRYRVCIALRGGTCLVYVDGSLHIETSDAYPPAGGIGLQTAVYHLPAQFLEKETWHEVWFDDVYVRSF